MSRWNGQGQRLSDRPTAWGTSTPTVSPSSLPSSISYRKVSRGRKSRTVEVKTRLKTAPEATRMMVDRWDRLKEEVLNKDVPKRYEDQLGKLEVLPG